MEKLGLTQPEDFKNDPYGYVTNQIGHVYLGFFFTSLYCFIMAKLGTYPNQILAICVVVGLYFLWWELMVQEWRGFDTIEDSLYVFGGTSAYLFIDMQWVIDKLMFVMVVLWVPLLTGVIVRLRSNGR